MGKTAGSALTGGSDIADQMQQIVDPNQAEEFMMNVQPNEEMDGALSQLQDSQGSRPLSQSQQTAQRLMDGDQKLKAGGEANGSEMGGAESGFR